MEVPQNSILANFAYGAKQTSDKTMCTLGRMQKLSLLQRFYMMVLSARVSQAGIASNVPFGPGRKSRS